MHSYSSDTALSAEHFGSDALERSPFCKRISNMILNQPNDEGFVLSIEGEWGSGKTTALNFIQEAINELSNNNTSLNKPVIVTFNPWLVGKLKSLITEFYLTITEEIIKKDPRPEAKTLVALLILYANSFYVEKWSIIGDSIKNILKYSRIKNLLIKISKFLRVEKLVRFSKKKAPNLTRTLKKVSKYNILEQAEHIKSELKEYDKTIIVFIDDLDRMPPNEIYTMIRLLKAVSDFPRFIYVIALDQDVVDKSLKDAGIQSGFDYLEKVIQTRITLPKARVESLQYIVDEGLQRIGVDSYINNFDGEQDRLRNLYNSGIKYLIRTPRDIKRIFNRIITNIAALHREISFTDMFALETIALHAPGIYNDILANPEGYVGQMDDSPQLTDRSEVVAKYKEEREKLLEPFPQAQSEALKFLIEQLFPLTIHEMGTSPSAPLKASGRIGCFENLNTLLFSGVLSPGVSIGRVKDFITSPDDRMKIISSIKEKESLSKFLELLYQSVSNRSIPDVENFIDVLAKTLDTDAASKDDGGNWFGLVYATIDQQVSDIIEDVLLHTPEQDRNEVLANLMRSPHKIYASALLLQNIINDYDKFKKGAISTNEILVNNKNKIDFLSSNWVSTAETVFRQGKAFRSNGADEILHLYLQLEPVAARKIVEEALQSNTSFDELMLIIGRWFVGISSQKGRWVHIKKDSLDRIGLNDQIKSMAKGRLSDPALNSTYLRAVYESIVNGDKRYYS